MKRLLFSLFALIAFAGFAYAAGPLSGTYQVTDAKLYRSGKDISQENADDLMEVLGKKHKIEQYDNTIVLYLEEGDEDDKVLAFKTGENRYEINEGNKKWVIVFSGTKCTMTIFNSGAHVGTQTLRKL